MASRRRRRLLHRVQPRPPHQARLVRWFVQHRRRAVERGLDVLVDLDGDSLPDKVSVDSNGNVKYRPNLGGPGDTTSGDGDRFGTEETIQGIDSLGRSSDLNIDLHFEAYPVLAIQVGGGFGFDFGDRYFEDVNGDGRVDFIKPGSAGNQTVFYNVLNDNGVPMFVDSSEASDLFDRLEVPLDDVHLHPRDCRGRRHRGSAGEHQPPHRHRPAVARPHTGTIRVEGTAELTAGAGYLGDGAQVTIEHGGTRRWPDTLDDILDETTTSRTHDIEFNVTAGQAVFFRLHVIDNASDDEVSWDPTVTYLDGLGGSTLSAVDDANGRSQVIFDASDDFTLFGRTGARTTLSEAGDITVTVDVNVLPALSDDLEIVVFHGRGDGTPNGERLGHHRSGHYWAGERFGRADHHRARHQRGRRRNARHERRLR